MTTELQHPDLLQPGERVGSWRIEKVLGRGGFGRVFKVERNGLPYTMKMSLSPLSAESRTGEQDPRQWLGNEVAALLTSAPHPNLLRVHAVDCWPHPDTGYPYFITDYLDADDWHEWRWRTNPPAGALVDTFFEVVCAVGELHRRNVFHREIKAEHVLIRRADGRPFLIDFGTVRLPGAMCLTKGLPPGVFHLLPPEAIAFVRSEAWARGERFEGGVAADLYALGILLFQALTDAYPFNPLQSDKELVAAISTVAPPAPHVINPRVPHSLGEVALRLLEKRPEDRYADTGELLRALEEAAGKERDSPAWQVPLLSEEQLAAGDRKEQAPEVEEVRPQQQDAPPQEEARKEVQRPEPRARWSPTLLASLVLAGILALGSLTMGATLMSNQKGTPPMSTISHDSRTTSLRKLFLAGICALNGLGCPSTQVRPFPSSKREPCPQEAQQAMFEELGLTEGSELMLHLDVNQPGRTSDEGIYRTGPITGRVVHESWVDLALPSGTLLYGYIWTDGIKTISGREVAVARYTRALLPDGRERPVCIVLGTPSQGNWLKESSSKPEAAVLQREVPASPVKHWP